MTLCELNIQVIASEFHLSNCLSGLSCSTFAIPLIFYSASIRYLLDDEVTWEENVNNKQSMTSSLLWLRRQTY